MNEPTLPLPDSTAESRTLPTRPLPSGTIYIPGFEILGVLGRGGNGLVFKALQHGLNRPVAIKIVHQENASADTLLRLQLEAEIIARLAHPNIIAIHETGQTGTLQYLVLEYAEGGSLDQLLDQPPLDGRTAAELALPLARALHAAHLAGVIHRDLKPANVLRMADGTPKVTDFGLAKRLNEADGPTRTGSVMGTPAYMSPEQASGQTHLAGPATDVYGLGAILYALVAGRPPFESADILLTLEAVRFKIPLPVRRWNPDVPRNLETIIAKCLEKEPARRYPSAAELADDLQRFLEGKTIAARPTSMAEQLMSLARRRPTLVASWILGSLAVILAVLVMAALRAWQITEGAREVAEVATSRAEEALVVAEAAKEREARANEELAELFYLNQVQLAYQQALSGRIQRAREILAACPVERRDWEWHYVQRLVRPAHEFRREHPSLRDLHYTPEGDLILAYQTGLIERLSEEGERPLEYAESQIDVRPKPGQPVLQAGRASRFNVALNREGNRLYSCRALGVLSGWEPATGKRVSSTTTLGGIYPITHLALHPLLPDACAAYAGANTQGDQTPVFDRHSGRQLHILGGFEGTPSGCDYSPDGKYLVAGDLAGLAHLWQVPGYQRVATLRDHLKAIRVVRFHPQSRLVMTGGQDGRVNLWSVPEGKRIASHSLPHPIRSAAWSHDGSMLAIGLEDGGIWTYSQERLDLLGYANTEVNNPTEGLSFRADDRMLASAAADGTVRVWNVIQSGGAWLPPIPLLHSQAKHIDAEQGQCLIHPLSGPAYLWKARPEPSLRKLADQPFLRVVGSQKSSRVVGLTGEGKLYVFDLSGQPLRPLSELGPGVLELALSPDGGLVVAQESSYAKPEVVARETATGKVRWRRSIAHTSRLVFSPDGKELSILSHSGEWSILTATTGETVWENKDRVWISVVYSPSGKRLAALSQDGVSILDATTRQELHFMPLKGTSGGAVFTHDDERLAISTLNHLMILDADRGRVVLEINSRGYYLLNLGFSPQGDLFGSGPTVPLGIWASQPQEKVPLRLPLAQKP